MHHQKECHIFAESQIRSDASVAVELEGKGAVTQGIPGNRHAGRYSSYLRKRSFAYQKAHNLAWLGLQAVPHPLHG
jgi:hypothetical protein